jgi:predicted outer membrane lipoprotein
LTGVLAAFGVLGAISQHTTPTRPLARMTFLALVISGFLTATSMLVCTFPILGTSWMERMADLHRYAGLGLVASASLHLVAARTA